MYNIETIVLKISDKHYLNVSNLDELLYFKNNKDLDVLEFKEKLTDFDLNLFALMVLRNDLVRAKSCLSFSKFAAEDIESKEVGVWDTVNDFYKWVCSYFKNIKNSVDKLYIEDEKLLILKQFLTEACDLIVNKLTKMFKDSLDNFNYTDVYLYYSRFFNYFLNNLNVVKTKVLLGDLDKLDLYSISIQGI